jgi:4-hydroxy-tetrahydrodipicolinate reductase
MKIGVIGYGKMGKAIEKAATQQGHNILFKINSKNTHQLNKETIKKIDVAIEFSNPEHAFKNVQFCINHNTPIVSGTTGWEEEIKKVKKICLRKKGSFLHAPNFSIGMNLFFEINDYVAKLMSQKNYAIEIQEKHHQMKKDSPSGTAIKIGKDIYNNLNKDNKIEIPIKSKRIGKLKGEHVVNYISKIDEITIKHKAKNRLGFSKGAILAAEFIHNKTGCFTMTDVIQNL